MKQRIERFLEHLATERRVSGNTIIAYRNDLRQFGEYLDSERASRVARADETGQRVEIDRQTILDFLLSLKEDNGYAPATVARKIAAVKSLYHFLREQGEISQDPTAELGTPQVKKPLPRAISVQDVNALLAQTETRHEPDGLRDRAMLVLLYATGMRVTELVSLNLADVDLDRGTVRCTGRAERVRTIPVDSQTVHALREYITLGRSAIAHGKGEEQALFLNHRGLRLTRQGFWLIMKQLAKQAGIQSSITPHVLRHSFAAHSLHDGIALDRLKEILGHANISTTQVYTQLRTATGQAMAETNAIAPAKTVTTPG